MDAPNLRQMKEEYQYTNKETSSKYIAYFFIILLFIGNLYFLKKTKELKQMNIKQELQKDSVLYLQVNLLNKFRYMHISPDSLNNIIPDSLSNDDSKVRFNKSITNK